MKTFGRAVCFLLGLFVTPLAVFAHAGPAAGIATFTALLFACAVLMPRDKTDSPSG